MLAEILFGADCTVEVATNRFCVKEPSVPPNVPFGLIFNVDPALDLRPVGTDRALADYRDHDRMSDGGR